MSLSEENIHMWRFTSESFVHGVSCIQILVRKSQGPVRRCDKRSSNFRVLCSGIRTLTPPVRSCFGATYLTSLCLGLIICQDSYSVGLQWKLNEITHVKWFTLCSVHSRQAKKMMKRWKMAQNSLNQNGKTSTVKEISNTVLEAMLKAELLWMLFELHNESTHSLLFTVPAAY